MLTRARYVFAITVCEPAANGYLADGQREINEFTGSAHRYRPAHRSISTPSMIPYYFP